MQNRKLPPLKALHAFASASQHLSFSRAAEELCVSAAAVSHQIRLLERQLNTPLFERLPRGLVLTPAALSLQSVCDRAFSEIGDVIETIGSEGKKIIRLASLPHFSGKALYPAVHDFMARHTKCSIEISHTLTTPDFGRNKVDFAVLFGKGNWPSLESDLLFHSPISPACSPSLLKDNRISRPEDITSFPILLDHACFQVQWIDWFRAVNTAGWEKLPFVPCDDIHALLGAAQQGFGFIMEPEFMIGDLLENGSLAYPFPDKLLDYGYYVVYPKQSLSTTVGRACHQWITSTFTKLA
jgi:DNA-binding transcriptional LysR family regulator